MRLQCPLVSPNYMKSYKKQIYVIFYVLSLRVAKPNNSVRFSSIQFWPTKNGSG